MVASGVAYVASTLAFTHRMHRTHLDALRLGYENLALLEQVRREEAAERSNLEKSRFLAAASHDLRQPVLAVSLFLGLLTNENSPRTAATWWTTSPARRRRWGICSMPCSISPGWTPA